MSPSPHATPNRIDAAALSSLPPVEPPSPLALRHENPVTRPSPLIPDVTALERWQVHPSRLGVLAHWRDKEWWYSGAYDARTGVYVSWYFIRVNLVDQFAFSVFDPRLGKEPIHLAHKLYLDPQGETPLSLSHRGRWEVVYEGSSERGWQLRLKDGEIEANLHITPSTPAFTKFDNPLVQRYGLLHHFHNRVRGSVRAGAHSWKLENALGYYDHCFGTVPRQTGWHWLAVQNEAAALATLVNYGPHAQRYTQMFLRQGPAALRDRWIRLGQEVSFEQPPGKTLTDPWRVTSPDLDLQVTPLQAKTGRENIPLFLRLEHSELFVQVEGRVRLEGQWVETGVLHGVMEQHGGRW